MSRPRKWGEPKGAIELLEEAVELLRRAPLSALAAYYVGSVPFGLGILYFWADMSRSSEASENLVPEALGLAFLFLWMKVWQTLFARILWKTLCRGQEEPWSFGRSVRVALTQLAIQPWGLLAVPVAMLVLIPLPWVYAFFQNITVLGDGSEENLKALRLKAWKMAGLWTRQNTLALLIVHLFGLFLFLNISTVLVMGPMWLKELFGVETLFSRSLYSLFNTTFFAAVCMLTYLCSDPLIKTAYTLRCFYGQSLYNGEDLKAELKASVSLSKAFFLALVMGLSLGLVPSPAAAQQGTTVKPASLDHSIEEALKGQEYRWHMPRVKPMEKTPDKPGVIAQFLEDSLKTFVNAMRKVGTWLDKFFSWLNKLFESKTTAPDKKVKTNEWDFEWLYVFLWILLGVVVCALVLLVYRLWNRRDRTVVEGQAVLPKPDVADERVSGNELPMDGWLQMAHDLLKQGNFRLALRAFYLASLACLARQRLLTIAKFKSTLDYDRELDRRAHSIPQLVSVFRENGLAFDRGWYGDYEITRETVETFADNHEKIRMIAEPPVSSR